MHVSFFDAVRAQFAAIESRWLALIQAQQQGAQSSPQLTGAIDQALADVTAQAQGLRAGGAWAPATKPLDCGLNPWSSFYSAGERAVSEACVDVQARQPRFEQRWEDVLVMVLAFRQRAKRDIDRYCVSCPDWGRASKCPYSAGTQPNDSG